jgi:hypothetical protein
MGRSLCVPDVAAGYALEEFQARKKCLNHV